MNIIESQNKLVLPFYRYQYYTADFGCVHLVMALYLCYGWDIDESLDSVLFLKLLLQSILNYPNPNLKSNNNFLEKSH
jgi:hypothetical protein